MKEFTVVVATMPLEMLMVSFPKINDLLWIVKVKCADSDDMKLFDNNVVSIMFT